MSTSTAKKSTPEVPAKSGYHHGNLREALIRAALRHLDQHHNEDISLRELARQVGVTANAVYRHFENKEALLAALAADGYRQLLATQVAAETAAALPGEVLQVAGRSYIRFAAGHPALYRLMFGRYGAEHREGELGAAAQESFLRLQQHIAAALGIKMDDPGLMPGTVRCWGLVHGLSQLLIDGQLKAPGIDPELMIEAALRIDSGLWKERA